MSAASIENVRQSTKRNARRHTVRGLGAVWLVLALLVCGCPSKQTTTTQPEGDRLTPPIPNESFIGYYSLKLIPDDDWHYNFVQIDAVSEDGVRGMIQIDRGIGPVSRMPEPDESAHLMSFLAKPVDNPNRLQLTVYVGIIPRTYAFDLYLCPEAGEEHCKDAPKGKKALMGALTITWDDDVDELHVIAKRDFRPADPSYPKWEDVPRGDLPVGQ